MMTFQKIELKVADLPRIRENFTLRVLKIREDLPDVLLRQNNFITLRSGYDMAKASSALFLKKKDLTKMGISKKGIDCVKLDKYFQRHNLKNSNIREKDRVLDSRAPSYFNIVLGRLGAEEEVFGPFNIEAYLSDKSKQLQNKAAVFAAYLKKADLTDLQTQAQWAFHAARISIPLTPHLQSNFLVEVAHIMQRINAFKPVGKVADGVFPKTIEKARGSYSRKGVIFSETANIFLESALGHFPSEELRIIILAFLGLNPVTWDPSGPKKPKLH